MKVKELIEKLKQFPEDMDVAFWRDVNYWESVYKVELIEDAYITSCSVDDEERKKEGKDIESFVGLSF